MSAQSALPRGRLPLLLRLRLIPLCLLLCTGALKAAAEEQGQSAETRKRYDNLYVQLGYGLHWDGSDDYRGIPALLNFEWSRDDGRLLGISPFNNSFGQASVYAYFGHKWRLSRWNEALTLKLSGGFIYGYVGEFEDRLKPNWNGFAPAIIPSLGWKKRNWGFDVAILGGAGLMVMVGRDIGD